MANMFEIIEIVLTAFYIDLDFFGFTLKPIEIMLGLGIADTIADLFYLVIRRGDDGRVYDNFE